MAKSSKKQQKRLQKKKKSREEKRRQLRHNTRDDRLTVSVTPEYDRIYDLDSDEQILRSRIQGYSFAQRFEGEIDKAVPLYFGRKMKARNLQNVEDAELANFQEWYFFDYELSSGGHIIDLFIDNVGPSLSPVQLQMAQEWKQTNFIRLLEVQDVTPGVGETVQDLLTGEILVCEDIRFSQVVGRWAIALARPLKVLDKWNFTGAGRVLSPQAKKPIIEFALPLWESYQSQNPDATIAGFYRSHFLQIQEFVADIQQQINNPAYVTAEGHDVINAKAEYRIQDVETIIKRLDETVEYVYAGDSHEVPGADHYNWLERGRSNVPENEDQPKFALALQTQWTMGPDQPSYLSLGDLAVWSTGMELSCMSRERLVSGRALLEEILGAQIAHKRDSVEEFDFSAANSAARETQSSTPPTDVPGEDANALTRTLMEQKLAEWLEMPMPALENLNPRQAAQTEDGRAELREMLKLMEYSEAGSSKDLSPFTTATIRKELNLDE